MVANPEARSSNPEVMGGTVVFAGTRVPVQTFFEYFAAGDGIEDFLLGFPSVSREQILAVLGSDADPRTKGTIR
jgi:uncharacterized protein (DUF433 family)